VGEGFQGVGDSRKSGRRGIEVGWAIAWWECMQLKNVR
jgi:hypothetical protein